MIFPHESMMMCMLQDWKCVCILYPRNQQTNRTVRAPRVSGLIHYVCITWQRVERGVDGVDRGDFHV